MRIKKEHYIVGVMGRTGSGKSYLVKNMLSRINRYIVIDPLHEYQGTVFNSWKDVVHFLDDYRDSNFRVVYRPPEGTEEEDTAKMFEVLNAVNSFTAVIEEADYHCSPHFINPEFARLMKYGRHGDRSLIWVSRNPAEVNRQLTRLSHAIMTFKQVEPIDLRYLSHFSFSKDVQTLEKYEWAYNGDAQIITKLTGIKIA